MPPPRSTTIVAPRPGTTRKSAKCPKPFPAPLRRDFSNEAADPPPNTRGAQTREQHQPPRIGRPAFGRSVLIGAAALGFAIGGYTLASAAQGAFFDDNPSPSDLAEVAATDVTTGDTGSTIVDDSTPTTIDDSTSSTIDDNGGDDNGSSTTVDDNGNESDDDTTPAPPPAPATRLPAPFTETYNVAGGSITVTWTGAKFVLDSVNAAGGHTAEIDDPLRPHPGRFAWRQRQPHRGAHQRRRQQPARRTRLTNTPHSSRTDHPGRPAAGVIRVCVTGRVAPAGRVATVVPWRMGR